ncbi:MAG: MerR family transcriptional regulator [Alphaproteobacteria bacterium]|nr:MerR family transcriptional regulator [Alphaproteobacteria bacterium]MBL0717734.1 MerR family transcriptional regulator [Alphaproteobacteria bacterium]
MTDNKVLSITKVAKMVGVSSHTIRFWEKNFTMLSPIKDRNGRRFYNEETIDLVKFIKSLLYIKGMTTAEAVLHIKKNLDPVNNFDEAITKKTVDTVNEYLGDNFDGKIEEHYTKLDTEETTYNEDVKTEFLNIKIEDDNDTKDFSSNITENSRYVNNDGDMNESLDKLKKISDDMKQLIAEL